MSNFFYWFLKFTVAPIFKWVWVRSFEGIERIPKDGRLIIASNHESYLDFLLISSVFPRRVRFLTAGKFFRSILWAPLMLATGQIKVDRKDSDKSEVFIKVNRLMTQEGVLGIFPEGTRSGDGKLKKAFTGVGKISLEENCRVLPVGIIGAYEVMPRDTNTPKLTKSIRIVVGDLIEPIPTDDAEGVTNRVMESISKLVNEDYPGTV